MFQEASAQIIGGLIPSLKEQEKMFTTVYLSDKINLFRCNLSIDEKKYQNY